MSHLGRSADADLYNLMHEMAKLVPGKEGAERRREPRSDFPSVERIAPMRGSNVPDESEFFEVKCRDLTRNGFSFFLSDRPDFDSLVVALATPPETIYVVAEVTHSNRVQSDTPKFAVGCRFVRRMDY